MQRYLLRRLIAVPLIVVVVATLTFVVLRSPWTGDPAVIMAGQGAPPSQIAALRHSMGLDKPLPLQYAQWVGGLLHGNFGKTFRGQQPVWREVWRRFPITAEIVVLAAGSGSLLGVLLGVVTAVRRNSWLDYLVRFFAVLGQSIPSFFLLILLIVLPSIWFNYAPPVGGARSLLHDPSENLQLLLPPALLLGLAHAAGMMRIVRSTMLDALGQDYIRTARAKGLRGRTVVLRHAFRNVLTPVLTITGGRVAELFFGALIVELIFSVDGLGQFFYAAVLARDFPVVQFLVVYTAIIVMLINLAVDLSYALVDPRVRYGS